MEINQLYRNSWWNYKKIKIKVWTIRNNKINKIAIIKIIVVKNKHLIYYWIKIIVKIISLKCSKKVLLETTVIIKHLFLINCLVLLKIIIKLNNSSNLHLINLNYLDLEKKLQQIYKIDDENY